MKTKSIMLIAVSLGFGLVAAIGMSQVLGQKSGDGEEKVEMTQVFVALVPLEIGDELNEDNLRVQKRPSKEVPENAITSLEQFENMVVIQKIPKDLMIVNDFICDKNEARLRKQPPKGYRAYTLKTALEDTHHNSIQPGDRVDIVGVFKVKNQYGEDVKMVSTFLKNIEVWQTNDRDSRLVTDEESARIATITVLLTSKQAETMTLAEDVASKTRVIMANRDDSGVEEEEFNFREALAKYRKSATVDEPEVAEKQSDENKQLLDTLSKAANPSSTKVEFKHQMTIYRGGQAVKYGFTDKNSIPKVIEQTSIDGENGAAKESTVTAEDDFSDTPQNVDSDDSTDNAPN